MKGGDNGRNECCGGEWEAVVLVWVKVVGGCSDGRSEWFAFSTFLVWSGVRGGEVNRVYLPPPPSSTLSSTAYLSIWLAIHHYQASNPVSTPSMYVLRSENRGINYNSSLAMVEWM